ncbi:hypothetical protein [Phaeobacter sp. JH18-37]|uniref:hypothetical protein n=1 Tax=Phaeobacter sp. JH18-37 TaxID=3112458 RepID=UPI003A854D9A
MDDFTDNTHRSLQNLVSVNAWFSQDLDDERRFTLHADVSFGEERLGGGSSSKVVFKLSVRRCDIVFVPPTVAPFRIDPSSVHSPRPLNPKSVIMKETRKSKIGGRTKLSLNSLKPSASVELEGSLEREKMTETSSEKLESMYHEVWKRINGNHAWTVDGRQLDNQRLAGPVFDASNQPRLTLVDRRDPETKKRDAKRNLEPVASIRVSCLREDIDIYDIAYKDQADQAVFETKRFKEEQLLTAREVLKEALVREGLRAGDISSNPFAEMVLCDVSITIIDESI